MREVLDEEIKMGYKVFKFKVGSGVEADRAKLAAVRSVIGYDQGFQLMIDANQVWSVPEAIDYMKQLVEFKPVFIEGGLLGARSNDAPPISIFFYGHSS